MAEQYVLQLPLLMKKGGERDARESRTRKGRSGFRKKKRNGRKRDEKVRREEKRK